MPNPIKPPNPEIVRSIFNLLEERGVSIPFVDLEVAVAATCHWMEDSKRGQEFMAHLLSLDSTYGKYENKYLEKDGFGRLTKEIKPDSIIFLRGCIVNGNPYPINQIEITTRDLERCESCNSSTVCVKEVETPFGKEKLCSYCLSANAEHSFKEDSDMLCCNCSYADCNWHPVNTDAPPFENY